MKDFVNLRVVVKVLLSLSVSCLIVGLLLQYVLGVTDPADRPRLFQTILQTSLPCIGGYLIVNLLGAFVRTLRYFVLLKASTSRVPSLYHVGLVTVARNMFVDLLPARLGELSYIAMLNRGYRTRADACLSSLAISFIFDLIALACLVLLLIGYQALTSSLPMWLLVVFVFLVCMSLALLFFLFTIVPAVTGFLEQRLPGRGRYLDRFLVFSRHVISSLEQVRKAGIGWQVFFISLSVRIFKYAGLYLLFMGVVLPSFSNVSSEPITVISTLLTAEASASLPIPSFMSFGTYESGGAAALIFLGADKAAAVIIMLALHIISQSIDYTLGALAMVLFIFSTLPSKEPAGTSKRRRIGVKVVLLTVFVGGVGLFLLFQLRLVKKIGPIIPPDRGQAVQRIFHEGVISKTDSRLPAKKGFVVWSSNRYGSHDILMLTLPDKVISRLTDHPNTEYFPRISPDGKSIVFARSREKWVPQRNYFPWDVYLLSLVDGKERLIAEHGNVPTWSEDGKIIYFQRNGNQFVRYFLDTGAEEVVMETGNNIDLPASVLLETPSWSSVRNAMAVTLRGSMRETSIIHADGSMQKIANGCQLNWSPAARFLYYVDHGGKQQNAIYRVDPVTMEKTLLFDSPTSYSHEYFPRIANSRDTMVYGASTGGHQHDAADYEIFIWLMGTPMSNAERLTFHTGNDCWPDIYLFP